MRKIESSFRSVGAELIVSPTDTLLYKIRAEYTVSHQQRTDVASKSDSSDGHGVGVEAVLQTVVNHVKYEAVVPLGGCRLSCPLLLIGTSPLADWLFLPFRPPP